MKPSRPVLLLLLACGAIGMMVVIAAWDAEPRYDWMPLSQLLRHGSIYNLGVQLPQDHVKAIRQIGTNALPSLVKWIQYEPPLWLRKISDTSDHIPFLARFENRRAERAHEAVVGFWVLGPQASAAIPELGRLLNSTNQDVRDLAASALSGIGKEAIPTLLDVLTNRPAHRNFPAIRLDSAWYELRTNASLTVPMLIEHLRDEDTEVAEASAALLGMLGLMGTETPAVVPALCANLEFTNASVRYSAVEALGGFGDRGRRAVPLLIKALSDPDTDVRKAATNALSSLAPEALAKPEEH